MAETTFRSSLMRRVVRKVVVLSLISLAALIVLSMTAPRPSNLGPRNGRLAELPDSPNCVASMTDKTASKMEPLDVSRFDRPIESLKKVIAATVPRSRVVTESEGYLRYEFTSRFFRFVDDGEFLLRSGEEVDPVSQCGTSRLFGSGEESQADGEDRSGAGGT